MGIQYYSLEASCRGTYVEYTQALVCGEIRKILILLGWNSLPRLELCPFDKLYAVKFVSSVFVYW